MIKRFFEGGDGRGGPLVDTHLHVFTFGLSLAAQRRYCPDYEARPETLLADMQRAGVGRGVLVQPSFLGLDNGYLLETIAQHREIFAGIAVVEPDASQTTLDELRAAGVVGVRLNCIGQDTPDLARGKHRALAERLATSGLVMELQAERQQWAVIAPSLKGLPCSILIDHFGRTPNGRDDFFAALMRAGSESEHVWFKFSGPYRMLTGEASRCAAEILRAVGVGRIVWGSDWPWTQFEGRHSYADTLDWLSAWVPNDESRRGILADNPTRLYRMETFS